jgi:hypothetical protein
MLLSPAFFGLKVAQYGQLRVEDLLSEYRLVTGHE